MNCDEDLSHYISLLTTLDEDDNDVLLFEYGESLAANAFINFEELRRNGKLCDVTLITDDIRFSAHRIVLAATVPYFRAMFTSELVESQQSEIYLKEMDADTVEQIITFSYTGKLRICNSNVQNMMQAANFLQLDSIVDECCKFLQSRLHNLNVLGIRSFAMTLGCVSVVLSADRFIHKHFLPISQGEEFFMLKVDEVLAILSRDELLVDNEQQVFEAAIRWLNYIPERSQYSARILQTVRLPLLKPQYIADEVSSHPFFKNCLDCRDLVDEAKDYYLLPERRKYLKVFKRVRRRCCHDAVGIIYAVGGLTNSGDSLSTVEMYNPSAGKWENTQAMNSIRSRVGVAVLDRNLYAIGGFNGHDRLRTVEYFDRERTKWIKVTPLLRKRSALGAAVINERIYVCGGYDGISSLSSVEVYDANSDRWTFSVPMLKQRSAAGITVIDNFIYVLGGHDGMSIFNSVERFNIETDQWSYVKPMSSKRCRAGAAASCGKLYVCGGYDGRQFLKSVEVYDPDKDEWSPLSPMIFKRSRVSLVSNGGMLYAIAGYDGISNLTSMEIYDIEADEWRLGPSMIAHEGGVGIGVIPLLAEKI